MVFSMGSIVANKSDDHSHVTFYNNAKDQLGIDTFGSGQLETLQAFILMGGYYLHYINRPNMANAIRRRTWWSLFCLDTWASTTLGRPSMGRWGPGITIHVPEGTHDPVSTKALFISTSLTLSRTSLASTPASSL